MKKRLPSTWLRWGAITAIVVAGLICCGQALFPASHPSATVLFIPVSKVPFFRSFTLGAGDAYTFRLPNGKNVAVWCEKQGTFIANPIGSDLDLEYGEKPFQQLDYKHVPLPDGGYMLGDLISYIRSGGTIQSGNYSFDYILYVAQYRVSLDTERAPDNHIALGVSVRLATEDEQLYGGTKRTHYLNGLSSPDPQKRLKAVNELGMMVSVGDPDAGNPVEVANAIRPLLNDPDPKIRKEALGDLQVMGDDDTLLKMLTPRPADEYIHPNGAWTIAGDARRSSDRIPRQVLSYFQSNDPLLQEFALAFFSCYRLPYPPAQPYVAKFLKSPVPAVRTAAASAIRFTCNEKQAVEFLSIALDDSSEPVLVESLKEAKYFNNSIPVERITRLLNHKSAEVRQYAAYALDCCQNPKAVEPLLAATRDPNAKVRAEAASTLGRIGNPKAYPRLLAMLADNAPEVRESAVNGLRWLGNTHAIPAIKRLESNDPNADVRQMAGRTVRELSLKLN